MGKTDKRVDLLYPKVDALPMKLMERNVSASLMPHLGAVALAQQKTAVELKDALGQGFRHVPSHRAVVVSSGS